MRKRETERAERKIERMIKGGDRQYKEQTEIKPIYQGKG